MKPARLRGRLIRILDELSGPTGWSYATGRTQGGYFVFVRALGALIASSVASSQLSAENAASAKVLNWIKTQTLISKRVQTALRASIRVVKQAKAKTHERS